jgi:anthranilate synthase component 1
MCVQALKHQPLLIYSFFLITGILKVFGSSPEAQIIVKDRKAEIILSQELFKRTIDDEKTQY